jgi:hypothetical protein
MSNFQFAYIFIATLASILNVHKLYVQDYTIYMQSISLVWLITIILMFRSNKSNFQFAYLPAIILSCNFYLQTTLQYSTDNELLKNPYFITGCHNSVVFMIFVIECFVWSKHSKKL